VSPQRGDEPSAGSRGAPDAAACGWPRWPAWLVAAYATALGAAVLAAMWLDLAADRERELGLAFLRPVFLFLASAAETLHPLDVPVEWILPAAALLVVASLLVSRVTPRAAAVAPVGRRSARRRLLVEVACLGGLSLVVIACRFHALNRIPRNFIGEMVFQVVCTSDWRTLLIANGGSAIQAPWAPIGLLHYLLMAALWRFSGATVLTLCFASAMASVWLLQALYWFVRVLGGPLAALIAAALYAASPLETVWGRNAMFPFNFPSIVVILTAGASYLALTRHRLVDWLAVVVLMALGRHTFGSAYAAFLIPIGATAWLRVFDSQRLRPSGRKPLLLILGIVAWLAGPALAMSAGAGEWRWVSPIDPRLEERAFRGSGWMGALDALSENVDKVVGPLYAGTRDDTIQTPTKLFDARPLTFVSPLATILFTAAVPWLVVRRRLPAVVVLVALVVAAVLPGLLSTADPHRQAALYAALCAIAGLSAAAALEGLERRWPRLGGTAKVVLPAVILAALLARSAALYFSQPLGEPPSVAVARAVKERVEPGTLLVLHVRYLLHVDLAYLLFDDSLVEPFGWMFIEENEWERGLADFRPRFEHLFHRFTALRHRLPELEATRWRRLVFVLADALEPAPKVEDLRRKFGAVQVAYVDPETWQGPRAQGLTIVTVVDESVRMPEPR
jgi:hypothetical protein